MEPYSGPGDAETDTVIECAFILHEAGVAQLFEEAAQSPPGEREYWR